MKIVSVFNENLEVLKIYSAKKKKKIGLLYGSKVFWASKVIVTKQIQKEFWNWLYESLLFAFSLKQQFEWPFNLYWVSTRRMSR